MTEQITLEQALELVSFFEKPEGNWKVLTVHGGVLGDVRGTVRGSVGEVEGDVRGDVLGDVRGTVRGSVGKVLGDVHGTVRGTINGTSWESVETPQEKLERLIFESGDQELIEAFNQLHQNNS